MSSTTSSLDLEDLKIVSGIEPDHEELDNLSKQRQDDNDLRSGAQMVFLDLYKSRTASPLVHRVKLLLTIYHTDHSVKPLDEWQLKRSLTDFLKSSFSFTAPEDDIVVRRFKDLKKRKCDDPVTQSEILHGIDGENDVKELEKEVSGLEKIGYSRGRRQQQPDTIMLKVFLSLLIDAKGLGFGESNCKGGEEKFERSWERDDDSDGGLALR
ncbi:hypothetical protein HYC85_017775 [Camellia sinensis]|uniref:Uncharacterized protein n=1 Tax=Camellia sinensis TaxID=4442 RepID=A0A7J7GW84_CAMSI|nr:hypothetical protein HYC85_017775 [Camellia sinensis]